MKGKQLNQITYSRENIKEDINSQMVRAKETILSWAMVGQESDTINLVLICK